MVNVHRHNPALRLRLKTLIDAADAEGLLSLLSSLTNSEQRTAGFLMGEELFDTMPNPAQFLDLFLAIVPTQPKAYLGTFLKAAAALYQNGHIALTDDRWQTYAHSASDIDKRKILEALLPILKAKRTYTASLPPLRVTTPTLSRLICFAAEQRLATFICSTVCGKLKTTANS